MIGSVVFWFSKQNSRVKLSKPPSVPHVVPFFSLKCVFFQSQTDPNWPNWAWKKSGHFRPNWAKISDLRMRWRRWRSLWAPLSLSVSWWRLWAAPLCHHGRTISNTPGLKKTRPIWGNSLRDRRIRDEFRCRDFRCLSFLEIYWRSMRSWISWSQENIRQIANPIVAEDLWPLLASSWWMIP